MRLAWIGVAFALVLLATPFFDRFDPARGRRLSRTRHRSRQESAEAAAVVTKPTSASTAPPRGRPLIHLTPLGEGRSWGLHRMFVAELRLLLKGYPWWWYVLAGGLIVAQCVAPLEISRGPLLTAAWIWPILLWSAMGTREARHGTEQLIFTGPRVVCRQVPASWLAGVVVVAVMGGGVAVRLLLAPNYSGLLGWFAGALFIPTLALALGVWTKSSRPFEGLFTGVWYIGPLNTASRSGP